LVDAVPGPAQVTDRLHDRGEVRALWNIESEVGDVRLAWEEVGQPLLVEIPLEDLGQPGGIGFGEVEQALGVGAAGQGTAAAFGQHVQEPARGGEHDLLVAVINALQIGQAGAGGGVEGFDVAAVGQVAASVARDLFGHGAVFLFLVLAGCRVGRR
jgi:hypothetical protein